MAIDTKHADYIKASSMWEKCRDASDGQDCVHEKGETYLPKPSAYAADEYKAYKGRALYYNATGRTIDGLSGMIFRRPPKFEIPANLEFLNTDVDTAGTPLLAFCEKAVEELIRSGRMALLADFPPVQGVRTKAEEEAIGARPYLKMIQPEAVINWQFSRIANRQQLTLAVIAEKHATQKDAYTWEEEDQLRALRLVDGAYLVEIWRKVKDAAGKAEWTLVETISPMMAGKPIAFIPMLFCGPMGVSECVEKSPMIDLVNVNLSHYRTSADYEHGLHFTGLPTPIVTGHTFDEGEKFALGSSVVKAIPSPDAKVFFLEFEGTGLAQLAARLKEKEEMMAALGARMLGADKRAAETAETAAIHRSGENSVLASLANGASAALSKALTWCGMWAGIQEPAKVELNTDYLPAGLSAQEVTALVGALQAGAISGATFYDNMQRGEIARQGVDWEQEKGDIDAAGPALGAMGDATGAA